MFSTDKLVFKPMDLLIPAVAVLAAGIVLVVSAAQPQPAILTAEVTVGGEVVRTLSLDADVATLIETADGVNRVVVADGKVTVGEADCDTQVCVRHRAISRVGESIVCAPHGLVVTIVGADVSDGPDLIAR